MGNKVTAPFTEEQVERLKRWQTTNWLHPFTCMSPDLPECERRTHKSFGILVPTTGGWVCPCGQYKQDWAHDFMVAEELPPNPIEELLKRKNK